MPCSILQIGVSIAAKIVVSPISISTLPPIQKQQKRTEGLFILRRPGQEETWLINMLMSILVIFRKILEDVYKRQQVLFFSPNSPRSYTSDIFIIKNYNTEAAG